MNRVSEGFMGGNEAGEGLRAGHLVLRFSAHRNVCRGLKPYLDLTLEKLNVNL